MAASRAWWRSPWIVGGLIVAGLAVRAFAYFSNVTPLLDEILLSRHIIEAPVATLAAAPLSLDQVAPRGFLLAERLSVTMFGPNELALRLVPFLCGLATLWLFWRLARRVLTGGAAIIALALVAIGVPFVL